MRSPKGTYAQLATAVKILKAVIDEEDSRTDEDKVVSTDNCISAFGKLVLF